MQVFFDHVLTDVDVHLSANLTLALELNHFNAAISAFSESLARSNLSGVITLRSRQKVLQKH